MRKCFLLLASTALAILQAAQANAHGIWIAQRHGAFAIVYGHGASDEEYAPSKVTSLLARGADSKAREVAKIENADHVTFKPSDDTVLVTSTFDNGYWSEGADGKWVNKPKAEVPGAKQSGQYLKYATAILGPLGKAPEPQGLGLEIVASVDPTTLKAGDDLPLLILANGKPAEGAEITAEYTTASEVPAVKTGADGKITIKVRNQGLNVVVANLTVKTPDSKEADEIGHTATLSFSLGHGEE
jgi:nickel transport protein